MTPREAGILLPLPSLPGRFAVGDLGPGARRFLEFLTSGRQSLWQLLPVGVTEEAFGNSPYSSLSAFALDPLLLSPEDLLEEGLLEAADVDGLSGGRPGRIEFETARGEKARLVERAFQRFRGVRGRRRHAWEIFQEDAEPWLEDFALFMALREASGAAPWTAWDPALRDRRGAALRSARKKHRVRIEQHRFAQFLLHRQWGRLRDAAQARRIRLLGDVPLYVAHDSADVWAHRDLFALHEDGRPAEVAGVPPDYFSSTGQLWGTPVYRWERHAEDAFAWWRRRLDVTLDRFDAVRLDHFRGLSGYWSVPAYAATAAEGAWRPGPGSAFLSEMLRGRGTLPIIAEDLGTIDAEVRELKHHFALPGMVVLQFAFGGDFPNSEHLPHRHVVDSVVFTGTHDNNTTRGWFHTEADGATRRHLDAYLGRGTTEAQVAADMMRLAYASVAARVLVPLQDVLGLGAAARLNRPGAPRGNWRWRAGARALADRHFARLAALAETYGRA